MKENKMGVLPVNKLLLSMSVPIMISMLVQAFYNIVDSMFVAQVSENALTAVSLAFPIQQLLVAIGVGTGVGINALASRGLGEKNYHKSNMVANNGLYLSLIATVIFVIFGIFGSRPFFEIQVANEEIVSYGTQYLMVVCCFSIGIFTSITFERILQATGKTTYTMITQGLGAIINIILDPIFIFGLFGMPRLEVMGAAIATVIGQIASGALGLYFSLKKNPEIEINLKKYPMNGHIIKMIYGIGIPSIIMQSIGSLMTFGMNLILLSFTATASTVFGVYFKLQSFVFMPVFGLNNGLVPIISYNFGAKHAKRMSSSIKLATLYASGIMLFGLGVFELFPDALLSIFAASDAMLSIGIPALRIIAISFIFAGVNIVLSSVFQALGHGMKSLMVSILRQLFVLLPCAFVLSFISLDAIWWAFPIAELAAFIVTLMMLKHVYDAEINPIYQEELA